MLDEDEMRDAVLLVFCQQARSAQCSDCKRGDRRLGLHNLRQRQWFIQSAFATTGDGLYEGSDWLSRTLSCKE